MLSWTYLIVAGLFEMGWPLGFKLANAAEGRMSWVWIGLSVLSMMASGYFLFQAQKTIPIGTAYIVWTAIGGVGTAVIGMIFFGDSTSMLRIFFLFMILVGVIGLKLAH